MGIVYKRASELGCALNVNLDTGAGLRGGMPTDDTAVLNRFLATATQANPIVLEMDGAALITGLRLAAPGYTTITGQGDSTGFFLQSGSNNDAIHNRPDVYKLDPGPPAPPRTMRALVFRHFRINGNRGDGHSGNSNSGNPRGNPWRFGLNILNAEEITIDGLTLFHVSTYGVRLSNVGHARISNTRVQAFTAAEKVEWSNTDGIHINGPANDISISHCYFRTGDDGIALNAPEGYRGTIERVSASDCVFDGCEDMIRIYSGSRTDALVRDVTISRFSGTSMKACFVTGLENRGVALTTPDAISGILIQDCQVLGDYCAFLQDNAADITFRNVVWKPGKSGFGMIATLNHALTIKTLALTNCTVQQVDERNIANSIVDLRGAGYGQYPVQIGRLVLDGVACQDSTPHQRGGMPTAISMSAGSRIATLEVDAANPANIGKLLPDDQWQQVGSVTGRGLAATHWAVPDGKVADGVPYHSDETGLLAIKHEGMAHTLLEARSQDA